MHYAIARLLMLLALLGFSVGSAKANNVWINDTNYDVWIAGYVVVPDVSTRPDRMGVRGWTKLRPGRTVKLSAKGVYIYGKRSNGSKFTITPSASSPKTYRLWVDERGNFNEITTARSQPLNRSRATYYDSQHYKSSAIALTGQGQSDYRITGPNVRDAIRSFHAIQFSNDTNFNLTFHFRWNNDDEWRKKTLAPGKGWYWTNGASSVSPQISYPASTSPGNNNRTARVQAFHVRLPASDTSDNSEHTSRHAFVSSGNRISIVER